MLKPHCPHCNKQVNLLGEAWQAQRSQKARHCPHCLRSVDAQFKASIYLLWLVLFIAAGAVVVALAGFRYASFLFVAAAVFPLLPSIYLRPVP